MHSNSSYDDDFEAQTPGAAPSTPVSSAPKISNFYFAQLEEIERFGLTTLYVDYDNLEKFTVNGETGVLAQAIAQQYYRYLPFHTPSNSDFSLSWFALFISLSENTNQNTMSLSLHLPLHLLNRFISPSIISL